MRKRGNRPELISKIKALYNNRCQFKKCRDVGTEVHHIKPVCKGGTDRLNNLTLYCRVHHLMQHDRVVISKLNISGIDLTPYKISTEQFKKQIIQNNKALYGSTFKNKSDNYFSKLKGRLYNLHGRKNSNPSKKTYSKNISNNKIDIDALFEFYMWAKENNKL